jgi:DNA polymerase-3 subunit gamma/tau
MARILAKSLNCPNVEKGEPCCRCDICDSIGRGEDMDVIEIDGASNRRVEEIGLLRESCRYRPSRSRLKIYIIDEVHMLTQHAFNALLKTLEEPPDHVKFIFATTAPRKVPETIRSRCQNFDFKRIARRDMVKRLREICELEGIQATEDLLWRIAREARGAMRDSQTLLDQLVSMRGKAIAEADLEEAMGLAPEEVGFEMIQRMATGDISGILRVLDDVYRSGWEAGDFIDRLLDSLRAVMLLKTCGRDSEILRDYQNQIDEIASLAEGYTLDGILYCLTLLNDVRAKMGRVLEERVLLEATFAKMARLGDVLSVGEMLRRLDALEKRLGVGGGMVAPRERRQPPREGKGVMPAAAPPPAGAGAGTAMTAKEAHDLRRGEAKRPSGPVPSATEAEPPGPRTERAAAKRPDRGEMIPPSLKDMWAGIADAVSKEKRSLGRFLKDGAPLSFRKGRLTLGFHREQAFSLRRIDDGENRKIVEAELEKFLGQKVTLETKLLEENGAEQAGRRGSPETDLAKNPMVRRTLEIFGGRLKIERERESG